MPNAIPRRTVTRKRLPEEDARRYVVRHDGARWLIWDQELGREHPTDLEGEREIRAYASILNDTAAQGWKRALD